MNKEEQTQQSRNDLSQKQQQNAVKIYADGQAPENQESESQVFREDSYRIVTVLLFTFISIVNAMGWVLITPISIIVGDAYGQSSSIMALIPMSYLICYIFINFPSNWVLDVKGIKKGIITGSVLTALGMGIRCLVNYSFVYLLIGQFLCAIAQPFILNAPTKVAGRWFMQKNRSLAVAFLSVMNIIGCAIGMVIPTIFVQKPSYNQDEQTANSMIQDHFWYLCMFQFCLAAVSTILNLIFFKERPAVLPSLSAMVENTEFKESIKVMFTSKKYLLLAFSFSCIIGAFNIYGSLLDELLDPYGVSQNQISTMGASMMFVGIISAALIGIYVEKTLKYHRVFVILAIFGVLQTISFVVGLKEQAGFTMYLILVLFQGMLFIPMLPVCFDYGCDIMFPIGQAQITGTLMTSGQVFGIFFVIFQQPQIVISQQVFKLGEGDDLQFKKNASFKTAAFVGVFLIVGCILLAFFNSQLKRSKLQKPQIVGGSQIQHSFSQSQQNSSTSSKSSKKKKFSDNSQKESLLSGKNDYDGHDGQ